MLNACRPSLEVKGFVNSSRNIEGDLSNQEIAQIIAPYSLELAAEMDVVLCLNERDMVKTRPESAIGNFFSDACLLRATQDLNATVDAAMFNTGGIRAAMAAGEVTVRDIFQLMPFDNELVIVEMPYKEVMNMLDYLATTGGEPVSGIQLVIGDGEIVLAEIDGSPVEERNYRILTSDYLAQGGDKMDFFTEGHRVSIETLGMKVRDALLTTCRELGKEDRPIDYHTDGRIREEQ